MQLIKFEGLTDAKNKRLFKLLSFKVGYYKLWTDDTGRSMTGAFKGTLMGIFPKLSITVHAQNDDDRSEVLEILNSDFWNISYYDTEYQEYCKKEFYFGDVIDEIKKAVSIDDIRHKSLDAEAVATKKRTRSDIV